MLGINIRYKIIRI